MADIQLLRLPDLLRDWPCESRLSLFYQQCKQESSNWTTAFRPFDKKGQKAFDDCDLNLLACLTYSNRDREFIRLACDLMNFFFVYDEYTDVSDPSLARYFGDIVLDAMRLTKDRSTTSKHFLGEMTKDFWLRASAYAQAQSNGNANQPTCLQNFITTMDNYVEAVACEARDRAEGRTYNVEEYLELRRRTSGAEPTLAFIEFGLHLSQEILEHPTIKALNAAAVEMVVIVNDMHSYMREVSCGLGYHNMITVIMQQYGFHLQDAFNWLGTYSDKIVAGFNKNIAVLPSFGDDMDLRVRTYVEGLAQWIRGEDDWSFESKRYHGNRGILIRETRILTIGHVEGHYLRPENPRQLDLQRHDVISEVAIQA
ncbi:terpenoid synthase [Crepidotus variabilis]|uniref:Terpene synthase n=1 Tax=Crepidotus variabilis TaxID=179855 RepID=A0A9P6EFP5_9AGAR|nr:terpenoid synthase [Crepidotus variabilis]